MCKYQCNNCKKSYMQKELKCAVSEEEVQISQFEVVERPYKKKKKDGTIVDAVSKITGKVMHTMKYKDVFKKLMDVRTKYLIHKYQVHNDKYHSSVIAQTVEQYGPLFHMDYSENLITAYKFEPQSSHFNKTQYSLHCTVKQTSNGNVYLYHLSDEKKHNQPFTSAVIDEILIFEDGTIILRFKSDNCAPQYKCKWVFLYWRTTAIKLQKVIIIYYGVSGHGKGLVDAMSGFGVKGPLRKAVITENFSYSSAEDIYQYLVNLFRNDDSKVYKLLSPEEIASKTLKDHAPFKIKGCQSMHMIAFHPDGAVYTKTNICSCKQCLIGQFTKCKIEKGKVRFFGERNDSEDESGESIASNSEFESDSDSSDDENESDEDAIDMDVAQLRSENVFDIISIGCTIALFSPPNSNELFYLCKVLEFGEAKVDMLDSSNHVVGKGQCYIKCNYYERTDERRMKVYYKEIKEEVFVFPTQVMCPLVQMNDDLSLDINEYQCISDMMI